MPGKSGPEPTPPKPPKPPRPLPDKDKGVAPAKTAKKVSVKGGPEPTPPKPPKPPKPPMPDKDEIAAPETEPEDVDYADREPGKQERLQKILAAAGIASRRHAEELITAGRVQVNGQVVSTLGAKADSEHDHIRVDGKLLQGPERHRYYMLNKPKGYVTTVSDPEGRPTVMEFFAKANERLYPVGRLDYLSEGLLLMSNDGELANKLTSAASQVEKTYLVKIAGNPTEEELEKLRRGVSIPKSREGTERVRTSPAGVRQIREGENPWFEVVLIEGRNRELRKLFEQIGHFVEKIRRVGYGPLTLDVEPGIFRELEKEELDALRLAADGKLKMRRPNFATLLPKEAGKTVVPDDKRPAGKFGRKPYVPKGRGPGGYSKPGGYGKPGGFSKPGFKRRDESSNFRPRPDQGERPPRFARPEGEEGQRFQRPLRPASGSDRGRPPQRFGGDKPRFSSDRPRFDRPRPERFEGERPSSNFHGKPAEGGERTGGFSRPKPSFGGDRKPSYGSKPRPSFGGDRKPSYGDKPRPSFGGDRKSSFGDKPRPSFGGDHKPGFGGKPRTGFGGRPKSGFGGKGRPSFGGKPRGGPGGGHRPGGGGGFKPRPGGGSRG